MMKIAYRLLVSLAVVVGASVFAVAPALAEQKRVFSGSFGGACTPAEAAQGCVADPYPVSKPWGVAVDEATGDVYVADVPNYRVEEFGPKGEFILMFGENVNKTKVEDLASQPERNLCTQVEVEMGAVCQAGESTSAAGGFGGGKSVALLYVAVDNSTGALAGDVYVADEGTGLVSKFTAQGQLVTSWGNDGAGESPNGQLFGTPAETTVFPPKPAEPFIPNGASGGFSGIAVDASGNLWVDGVRLYEGSSQRLFEFKQEGKFTGISWIPRSSNDQQLTPESSGIAVDGEDNLYLGGFLKYSSSGVLVGLITDVTGTGVAVDAGEHIYVNAGAAVEMYASCHPVPDEGKQCALSESFGANHEPGPANIAVDSASAGDTLYAASQNGGRVLAFSDVTVPEVVTGRPSGVSATSATLNGTVNPSGVPLRAGVEGCRFEWGEYPGAYTHVVGCEGSVGSGSAPVAVHADISGIQPGDSYHYRLVAENANNVSEPSEGEDLVFGPPVIESESSTDVGSTSATVVGEVDPQNVPTRVFVEYGTTSGANGYGRFSPVSTIEVPATGAGSVAPHLQGLAPDTTYHYRVVAESVLAEGAARRAGADGVFTTQGAGAFVLPDAREWEMVSPAQKDGALLLPITQENGVIQAAANGDALAYVTDLPTESAAPGYADFEDVLSVRGADGWVSRDIGVPHERETGVHAGRLNEYTFFSEDLSRAIVQPFSSFDPALSAQASEQTAFLRTDFLNDNPGEPCEAGCYRPLVTGCPAEGSEKECGSQVQEIANVPPGTKFGEEGKCPTQQATCGPVVVGATPDAKHIVLHSTVALTEHGGPGLYEWSEGRLSYIGNGELGKGDTRARHAISNDGSRVFWSAGGHLYMYSLQRESSVQLDVPEAACGKSCGGGYVGAEYQAASSSGEVVVFADTQRLTANGEAYPEGRGEGAQGGDLYQCAIVEEAGGARCALSDLAPEGRVLGSVSGVSEDGSWVYFASNSVLENERVPVAGAINGTCSTNRGESLAKNEGERCNLYVQHDGVTRLVAVTSGADMPDWQALTGTVSTDLSGLTARASADGEWFAFMSQLSLTGYENRDATSGRPDEEVYEYHAPKNLETEPGSLVCASCDPTGARPHGEEYRDISTGVAGGSREGGLAGGNRVWERQQWIGGNVPGWTPYRNEGELYQSRYLSDSGRLFFNSGDGLVPRDENKQEDVYEFEPVGVGSCTVGSSSGSSVYEPARDFEVEGRTGESPAGCVGLISSGESPQESAFLDASESGGDVFFLTTARLSSQDYDNALDVYDAHECTGEAPCLPAAAQQPPSCETAEGCRAAAAVQPAIFGSPPSATFSGIGNAPPESSPARGVVKKVTKKAVKCKKGFTKKKNKCVKSVKKKKTKRAKKAKRATTDRRASR